MWGQLEIVSISVFIILTIVSITAIIIKRKNKKLNIKKLSFSQSGIHNAIKDLLPKNSELRKKAVSQSRKHDKEKSIRVIYTPDQKAYWVVQNTFYCADLINGQLDPSTGKPVETDGLSKKDIEKLLFILDNLKNG